MKDSWNEIEKEFDERLLQHAADKYGESEVRDNPCLVRCLKSFLKETVEKAEVSAADVAYESGKKFWQKEGAERAVEYIKRHSEEVGTMIDSYNVSEFTLEAAKK